MSSYVIRRHRLLDDTPQWDHLVQTTVGVPRQPQPVREKAPQPVPSVAALRKADPVNYLLPASKRWLMSLPREVRPLALATKYPRIVNLLAQQWNDHDACVAFFGHLLVDHRGNRQGFPVAVKSDVRIIQEYFLHSVTNGS
jgi:hypothetical protein